MREIVIGGLLILVIAGWFGVLIWDAREQRKLKARDGKEAKVETWV